MSHDDIESPIYRADLDIAFQTIDQLQNIVLPVRTLLISKGTVFNLDLPTINYTAELHLARDVYTVDNLGTKSTSPIVFFFKFWSREGVQFAVHLGSPAVALTGAAKLDKIKDSPFELTKALTGLNDTCADRGVALLAEDDLKNALTTAGTTLFDLINAVII